MGCEIKRIITIKEPIRYREVEVWKTKLEKYVSVPLSWSCDGVCWTGWFDADTYRRVTCNLDGDFYLRLLINGEFDHLTLDGVLCDCVSIVLYNENPFLQSFCDTPNLFNPYACLDCALLLQQQMSDSILCMFGMDAYYFKVDGKDETKDYTFKEYVLHEVSSVKLIKLLSQDGAMPSNKPLFTELDFEWETDWPVEVGKTAFARAFGDTAIPTSHDFIWVPMLNRMFKVNSAYDPREESMMYRSTTWKLALVKYDINTAVDTTGFSELIEGLVVNQYEDVFGTKERVEQERESGTAQADPTKFEPTNLTNIFIKDAVRSSITENEKYGFVDVQINNRGVTVARNMYNFTTPDGEVNYQNGFCGDDGTLMFIIRTPQQFDSNLAKPLVVIGDTVWMGVMGAVLCFGGLTFEMEAGNTYMVVASWNRQGMTSSLIIYKHIFIGGDVPEYMKKPNMYEFDFNTPVYSNAEIYNENCMLGEKQGVKLLPYPLNVSNLKLYSKALDNDEAIKESLKYTTKHEWCVINDVARPLEERHGFNTR